MSWRSKCLAAARRLGQGIKTMEVPLEAAILKANSRAIN
jgi:hypothetical protein